MKRTRPVEALDVCLAPKADIARDQVQPYSGVNTMAGKTSKKSAKVAKQAAAKRVAAKAAKPRKTAPKPSSRKVAKPALLAGVRRLPVTA